MGIPYNENPELMAMKQDLADRKFRVQMIGLLVTGLLIAATIASIFLFPAAASAVAKAGAERALITGVLGLGAGITTLFTLKEVKRLEMDEKFIQSYMQGKNYWGEGFREEVAERGYGVGSPFPLGAPPPQSLTRDR